MPSPTVSGHSNLTQKPSNAVRAPARLATPSRTPVNPSQDAPVAETALAQAARPSAPRAWRPPSVPSHLRV
eukprot:CAMPEP_0174348988 /NCGR_PEP_ID=MMETSP0811_2-20130205/5618_1 /TAXON_ID=73025 ORGANISM="Eutreptiella gymnastica-like, Strain CCMP1594" /NCGR_SAMPLE_ID=MMETSP0811_2 /ASSEMBLY_ACC=CAM_ASM_000667 /LENGTH=70 /DNA_ID=CAMNT_0015476029 /DNA_START=15 /DNA_END=227 /DNA_ORIENTATION=-